MDEGAPVKQEGTLSVGDKQKDVVSEQKDVSQLSAKDVLNNNENVKEESLIRRDVEGANAVTGAGAEDADPVAKTLGIPELVGHLLGFLRDNEDVKSMMTVSKDVHYGTQAYVESAEGKGRDAMHRAEGYEKAGELDKAMMLYAEHAAKYPPARERLEAFCFACKVFSPALRDKSMDDLKAMSVHELIVATGDALEALGELQPRAIEAALVAYCSDDNIPKEDREAVLGMFFDTMLPVLGSMGGKDYDHAPLRQIARRLAIRYPDAFMKLYDAGKVPDSFAEAVFNDACSSYERIEGSISSYYHHADWSDVSLTGDKADRENAVRHVVALGVRLGYSLSSIVESVFQFTSGEYTVGMAGMAMVGLESLPKILMEHAEFASSEEEIKDIVDSVQAMLKSDFSDINIQDKAKLVRVLVALMPKVENAETRKQIIQLLESQMGASTLYRMGKGVLEGVFGLINAFEGHDNDHLFQGEVDDYVKKDFAEVFLNMDPEERELWIENGGDYYVGLGLQGVKDYLDSLEFATPEERNKLEARYVAIASDILSDFDRSSVLRDAASVALNSIAQSTSNGEVMNGQAYLDALDE